MRKQTRCPDSAAGLPCPPVFSVSQLNEALKDYLDANPLFSNVCVMGEISNYKQYPSGHHYFSLKDEQSSLSCVMFRGSAYSLRFRPENGMQVIAVGRVSAYPRDGKVQLYVNAMMPSGAGDLQLAFERLKTKLREEGLFDEAHKKPLPVVPERIALITSPAGAAVHDMIRILGRRWPAAKVIVVPVRVQGSEAPGEIVSAIRLVNELSCANLIITGRGGGSMEDLWAFNDERVARAVYASRIPVISAVGHEPDVTIADYVADARASTPSNAAEIAVPDCMELSAALAGLEIRSVQAMQKRLDGLRKTLNGFAGKRVLAKPEEFFSLRRMDLDLLSEKLAASGQKILARRREQFAARASALDAMSPLKVLARGYSVTFDAAGKAVRSADTLKTGDPLTIRFASGQAEASVTGVSTGRKHEKK